MPRGDRTGPAGEGPRTGRGLGNCDPIEKKLDTKRTGRTPGRSPGGGFGGGGGKLRGRRRGPGGVTYFT